MPDVISKAAQVIRYERRNRRRIMSRVDLQCACCLVVTGAHYQRRGRGQFWDRGRGPSAGVVLSSGKKQRRKIEERTRVEWSVCHSVVVAVVVVGAKLEDDERTRRDYSQQRLSRRQ